MPTVAIKTELKCKLCSSAERTRIDALLEKRSKRQKDDSGAVVNAAYVLRRLAEWGIENPTLDNIKAHFKNHVEIITEDELAARQEAANEVVKAFEAGDDSVIVTADEALDFVIAQGLAEAHVRIQQSGKAGITVDHVLKAIDAKTRRKHNEAQDELLKALGGGIQQAFTKAFGDSGDPQEVIEGEVVAEIEEGSPE